MNIFDLEYRNVRPIFLSNNKLLCVNGSRSISLFTKDYKTAKTITLLSSVFANVVITCMHLIEGAAGNQWKIILGTSDGHLFMWMKGKSVELLQTFISCSISCISHIPGRYIIVSMTTTNKKTLLKIFPLNSPQLFQNELFSKTICSVIKEIQPHYLPGKSSVNYQSFSILSADGIISLVFLEPQANKWMISPILISLHSKYKSTPTSILSVLNSVLIVGFSNGAVALYLLKLIYSISHTTIKPDLLTTLHWHTSPVKALGWERTSKSLFSGAFEGVLCHWNSPLAPFLKTISPEFTPQNQSINFKNESMTKYTRSTRPFSTIPGFGSSFESISIAATGKMVIITSDNSLRVLPAYSPLDSNSNSILLLHRNGLVNRKSFENDTDLTFYPIQNSTQFPELITFPFSNGIQVIQEDGLTCSHVLGSMPSGLPLIPGTSSSFKYASSLNISSSEVIVAMQNDTLIQLALWRQNIIKNWIFCSSANEINSRPGTVFLLGPVCGKDDSFIFGTSTGQLSLWVVSQKDMQKKYILRRSVDNMNLVAMDLLGSSLIMIFSSYDTSWLSLYEFEPDVLIEENESLVLKSTFPIDSRCDYVRFLSKEIIILGSEQNEIVSFYSIGQDYAPSLCWTFSSELQKESKEKKILLSVIHQTLAVGILPNGPILTWNSSNKSPTPSCVLLQKLPDDISSMALTSADSVLLQLKSGKIISIPEKSISTNELPLSDIEDPELDSSACSSLSNTATCTQTSSVRMQLLVGKGPSSLIDEISELPSHALPSPRTLMNQLISGIGLSLQAI